MSEHADLEQDAASSFVAVGLACRRVTAVRAAAEILRDCRLKDDGVHHAVLGIARLHHLTLTA